MSAEAGLADGYGDEVDLPGACAGGVDVADDDVADRGAEKVTHVGVAVDEAVLRPVVECRYSRSEAIAPGQEVVGLVIE